METAKDDAPVGLGYQPGFFVCISTNKYIYIYIHIHIICI